MKIATGIYTKIINGNKWLIVSKQAISNVKPDYRELFDEAELNDIGWGAVDLSDTYEPQYGVSKRMVIFWADQLIDRN